VGDDIFSRPSTRKPLLLVFRGGHSNDPHDAPTHLLTHRSSFSTRHRTLYVSSIRRVFLLSSENSLMCSMSQLNAWRSVLRPLTAMRLEAWKQAYSYGVSSKSAGAGMTQDCASSGIVRT